MDEKRKAIPSHSTPVSEKPWDGPANEAKLANDAGAAVLRKAYAWIDPDKNPDAKAAYRFIHHEVSADGTVGAANMKACISGIGVLNGGRGGTTIPDADRKGVWHHLASHLEDGDRTPPELKSADANPYQKRAFPISEIRVSTGKKPEVTGYAAVFNSLSLPMFGFREVIRPGAFTDTIKTADVRGLWNHDTNIVLGRSKSGTLGLWEDQKGLGFKMQPPDTQLVRDMVLAPIQRGDVDQMSFGFRAVTDKWGTQKGEMLRELLKVDLFDVSPVTFPAYPDTDVQLRSILMTAGFEADDMAQALAKARSGEKLTAGEKEIIRRSIKLLNSCLVVRQAHHGEEDRTEDGEEVSPAQGRGLKVLGREIDFIESAL